MAAVIKIVVETSGGLSQVQKEVDDLGQHAKDSGSGFNALQEIGVGAMRAIGEAVTGLAIKGFGMLAGAVQDGIADAQKNAQIQAQTAAVLKSTGDAAGVTAQHVADYASSLSDAAGTSLFGDDQIQQSTNLLLTFGEIKGATLDAATAISVDMAQAMGGAPKDAAIQLGKALNDPVKGITALTRVGVVFSEEQKAQIQAMQEAGDMAGAQTVILNELNKEFGGSAAAAAAATGGWSEFNGRMGEAKEALGAALLPLLSTLADVLLTNVMPVIEEAAAALGPFIEMLTQSFDEGGITGLFNNIYYAITGVMGPFNDLQVVIDGFLPAIQQLIGDWAGAGEATSSFGEQLGYMLDTLMGVGEEVAGPFQTAALLAGSIFNDYLVPAFAAVQTVLQTQVMPILNDLASLVLPVLNAAVQIAAGFFVNVLVPAVQMLWSILTTVVLPVVAALAGWLADNLPGAIAIVANFLTNTLFPALNKVYAFIQANVIPILQVVAQWLIVNVPVAIQKTTDYWNTILWPALNKVWLFFRDNVIPIVTHLMNEVFTALNTATQEVSNFWVNTLEPALRSVWSFIDTYINPILNKLAQVVIAAVRVEVAALSALWNTVLLPAITAVYNFINDKVIPIFKALVETHIKGLKAGFDGLASFWNDTFVPAMSKVANFISATLAPQLATLNDNVLQPMSEWFNYIADAVTSLISALNSLADTWASMQPPDWVTGHSPPPMAHWFDYIAESVKGVNAQLPIMQMNLAAQMGPGGNSTISNASSRSFTYAPQITTSGNVSAPMDLALATSLAGV